MDHRNAVRLAIGLMAIAVFAQDPSDTLVKVRDKMLSELPGSSKFTCVETIDRSHFSRRVSNPLASALSCEKLSEDRKRGRARLRLDGSDRLRVAVTMMQGREIYSWTGPGTFSRSVEGILQWGPVGTIGTGAFGAHLLDVFIDPNTRFRILDENKETLEYGFTVPLEASQLIVRAGTQWQATGYEGSFRVDRNSLEMLRFTVYSEELPPETSMCELSTTNEYQGERSLGLLLPSVSRSHDIMRDATEIERVTTFSNCQESTEAWSKREPDRALELPEGVSFELALASSIDTASAAAGDVISAQLTEPILQPKSRKVLAPIGAKVTGRIIRMEHRLAPTPDFVVSLAFDTLEANGVVFRLNARSDGNVAWKWAGQPIEDWPMGTFLFSGSTPHYLIPAGYKSKWRTTAPTSK